MMIGHVSAMDWAATSPRPELWTKHVIIMFIVPSCQIYIMTCHTCLCHYTDNFIHDNATEKHKSLDGKHVLPSPDSSKGTKAADHKSFFSTSETKMMSRVRTSQCDV